MEEREGRRGENKNLKNSVVGAGDPASVIEHLPRMPEVQGSILRTRRGKKSVHNKSNTYFKHRKMVKIKPDGKCPHTSPGKSFLNICLYIQKYTEFKNITAIVE